MNLGLFNLLVFIIFFMLMLVVAYVLFVPINNENGCVEYCFGQGFKGGFCVKVNASQVREMI